MKEFNFKEKLQNKNILVAGGAGFVGSNLVKKLLEYSVKQITVIDNLLSAEEKNLPGDSRVRFLKGSITNDQILNQLDDEFEYIFHLATYHGNQSSIHNPLADHENNTLTTLKLFNRIKDFSKIEKVVYSSAGCTVAEKTFEDANATTENQPVSLYLDSPYQISKIIGEFYSNYFFKRYNLSVVKARFQNVYGPGEVLGAGQWRGTPATIWRNVTPTFIYKAIKKEALTVENGGVATRDFIYVDDIVNGLIRCALFGGAGEVYNLASGEETSILDLANLINKLTDNSTSVDYRPKRNWDNSGKRFGSTEKAKKQIGFDSKVSVVDGLKRTIEWTRKNIEFIDHCVFKHRVYHIPSLVFQHRCP